RRFGMGWVADPDSADGIADALTVAWAKRPPPSAGAASGAASGERESFTRRGLAERLARTLSEIA
ncbi:MAG TPA: hypothetical protein VJW75_01670, partial [Candidatus Eisenbacteria bacterium]|nr:hypothetical protein [Candidatus Eisenbacteria bacterium]